MSVSFKKLIKIFVSIGLFLRGNKSGLIIGITASTIVALIFFFIPPPYNDQIPEPEPPITQKEAAIIEELLVLSDSTTQFLKEQDEEDYNKIMGIIINKLELEENPYNANAHVTLGQMYMVFGNYRGALNEFNEAGNIDETLADPHFGIGYVLYDLAILDMIKRNLYEIYEPGIIYKVETIDSNNSNLPIIYYPSVRFHPDKRTRTILTMSLKEFNRGMTLQQFYRYDTNTTYVFFPPEELAERVKSTRRLLELEPLPRKASDDPIIYRFSWLIPDINPKAMVFHLKSKDVILERKTVFSGSDAALIFKLNFREAIYLNNTPINETVARQLLEPIFTEMDYIYGIK